MDGSAFNRIILWEIGMRVFEANPVTGVGLEGFSNAKEALAEEYRPQIDPVSHMMIFGRYRVVHNTYVNWLAEGGLVLFTPFLLFLLSGIIVPLPRPREGASREILAVWEAGRGIPIGILGFSVGAFFLNANYNELFYWQVVLAGVVRVVLRLELAAAAETPEEPVAPPETASTPAPATAS
jgi:O-antigen ligase